MHEAAKDVPRLFDLSMSTTCHCLEFLRHLHAAVFRQAGRNQAKWDFVQARPTVLPHFDFLNPHDNARTEMQMVTLDAHLASSRRPGWVGHPLPFKAPAASGRPPPSRAGGGWSGRHLHEDSTSPIEVDKGWRALFLTSVAVPGEAAADTRTWRRQQKSWQDGSATSRCACVRRSWAKGITLSSKAAALRISACR